MTLREPGMTKRILVGVTVTVIGATILWLGSAVLESRSDVTALNVRVKTVEWSIKENADKMETIRKENREEHQAINKENREEHQKINDKLDRLLTRDTK